MISLNQTLCKELNLTYWQLKDVEHTQEVSINEKEYDLLSKILLAKGISVNSDMISIKDQGAVEVQVASYQLVFDDVNRQDSGQVINLAKLSDMLNNPDEKKHTWFKLKHLDL